MYLHREVHQHGPTLAGNLAGMVRVMLHQAMRRDITRHTASAAHGDVPNPMPGAARRPGRQSPRPVHGSRHRASQQSRSSHRRHKRRRLTISSSGCCGSPPATARHLRAPGQHMQHEISHRWNVRTAPGAQQPAARQPRRSAPRERTTRHRSTRVAVAPRDSRDLTHSRAPSLNLIGRRRSHRNRQPENPTRGPHNA